MEVCCIQLITLSCIVKFLNYMAKHCVTLKDHVASLKIKVTIQTYAASRQDENVFVSYSYPRFDCKVNISLIDRHGSSFFSSILYKSAFMDL